MEANVPYLIYFAKETENISLQNIDAAVTVPQSVTHGNVTFTGNYEAGRNMEGLYGVAEKTVRNTSCVAERAVHWAAQEPISP